MQTDPVKFVQELVWFYGVYDSECGLKSCSIQDMYATSGNSQTEGSGGKAKQTRANPSSDPYTDKNLKSFAFGRSVWRKVSQLPWATQQLLRRHYQFRQHRVAGADFGPKELTEAEYLAANQAYLSL